MFTDSWFRNLEQRIPEDIRSDHGRVFRKKPEFDEGINIRSERPFSGFGNEQIFNALSCSLCRDWSAFELSTILFNEAKHRNDKLKREVQELIKEKNFRPITWLKKARDCLRTESSNFRTKGATASNYFVLLVRDGQYECYVGQTATTNFLDMSSRQEARVIQHFCGIRASSHVKNFGHEPLWSLNCFTEKVRHARRIEAETKYNISLTNLGIRVRGDRQPQDNGDQN